MTLLTIDTDSGEIIKPRYRFRLNLTTGEVECLNGHWPPEVKQTRHPQAQVKPNRELQPPATFNFKVVSFPSSPCVCPKCRGRGIVRSQLDGKDLGICFWCDGKGSVDLADIANANRRAAIGLPLDNRRGY